MLEAPALPEVARASLSGPHRPAAAEGRGAAAMAEAALLLPAEPAAERDSREKLALWDRRPDTKAPLTDRQTDSVLELKAAAENLPVPAEVRRRAGPGLRRRRGGSAGMCPARADLGLADAGLPSLPPGGGGGAGGRGPSPPRAGRLALPAAAACPPPRGCPASTGTQPSPCGADGWPGAWPPRPRRQPRHGPAAHRLPGGEAAEPEVLRLGPASSSWPLITSLITQRPFSVGALWEPKTGSWVTVLFIAH